MWLNIIQWRSHFSGEVKVILCTFDSLLPSVKPQIKQTPYRTSPDRLYCNRF